MENRTILIANTKTQQRHEINTAATTLGELKQEMSAQGIDFSGMTFTEGISKTQLLTDASLLPTNVMYKGQPTNNLVMLLTNTTKNIASGMVEVDERNRKNAYAIIKEMGQEAMDEIKDIYGKNYTQCKTDDLWSYIDENSEEISLDEDEDIEDTYEDDEKPQEEYNPTPLDIANHIYDLVKALAKTGSLGYKEIASISERLEELASILREIDYKTYDFGESKISDADIDDMIASI